MADPSVEKLKLRRNRIGQIGRNYRVFRRGRVLRTKDHQRSRIHGYYACVYDVTAPFSPTLWTYITTLWPLRMNEFWTRV